MKGSEDDLMHLYHLYCGLSEEYRKLAKQMIGVVDKVSNEKVLVNKRQDWPLEEKPALQHQSTKMIVETDETPPRAQVTIKSHRMWAFCEAIDQNGENLIRYRNSTACWRAEIGEPKTTDYTGWDNANALESFHHKGWGIAFGNANHKEKGMRVIRPKKIL